MAAERHFARAVTRAVATPALLLAIAVLTAPAAQADSPYLLGPGDVIEVRVQGDESLSQTPTVQPSGMVVVAGFGELHASARTVEEIGRDLERRAAGADRGVAVAVKEYRSRFVTVLGEVGRPGRVSIRAQTRLIDALVEAGGFTANASLEVTINRLDGGFADGTRVHRVQLRSAGAGGSQSAALELPLRPGDVVIAAPRSYFAVSGAVARPGRYRIAPGLTLLAGLELAGGLTRHARHELELRRVDAATGALQIIEVDIDAIHKGSQTDPSVRPDDVISVSSR